MGDNLLSCIRVSWLEKVTREQINRRFGSRDGAKVADYLVKRGYGKRFVNVEYSNLPDLGGISYIWEELQKRVIQPSQSPDAILRKIADYGLSGNLNLFIPWGPRYKKTRTDIRPDDPEMETIRKIVEIRDIFGKPRTVLMPADVYGIEINGLDPSFVMDYFGSLNGAIEKGLGKEFVEFKPWSEIRQENMDRYRELREMMSNDWEKWISPKDVKKATTTAKHFNTDPEESALRYCRERLAECVIIGETYDPIKVSLVRSTKDKLDQPAEPIRKHGINGIDKILYIIPKNLRAPWLRGEEDGC